MIELEDERNLVRVLARDRAEHAERRGHGVAAAFDGELHDVLGIEVGRVRRERRAGGVLDALIDRQDRHVAGAAEPAGVEQLLQRCRARAATGRWPRRRGRRSRDPAGAASLRDRLALVLSSAASSPRISSMPTADVRVTDATFALDCELTAHLSITRSSATARSIADATRESRTLPRPPRCTAVSTSSSIGASAPRARCRRAAPASAGCAA